jgi:hypothetical protein
MGRVTSITPAQGSNYRTEYAYNANGSLDYVDIYVGGTPERTTYSYDTTSGKLEQRTSRRRAARTCARCTTMTVRAGRLTAEFCRGFPEISKFFRYPGTFGLSRWSEGLLARFFLHPFWYYRSSKGTVARLSPASFEGRKSPVSPTSSTAISSTIRRWNAHYPPCSSCSRGCR